MIHIKEVAYTVIPVRNIEVSRAFYEGVLGLRPGTTFTSKSGTWVEYELGSTTLSITSMIDESWQPSPHGAAVALEVSDFEAAVRWLREKGAKFQTEPWESPRCKMATVFDPDGGCVAIHQLKG